jgi:hypothetical protein
MINSAAEFVQLRTSEKREDYQRAIYEEASEQVWMDIIKQYPEMRFWVVQNKTIPLSILSILSIDQNPKIRAAIARKRKIPLGLLLELSKDADDSVRLAIAHHPKADISILKKLAEDQWDLIAEVAKQRIANKNLP